MTLTTIALVDEWAGDLAADARERAPEDPESFASAVHAATLRLIQRERERELREWRGYRTGFLDNGGHVVMDPHGNVEMWCADETAAVQAASALNRERLAAKAAAA